MQERSSQFIALSDGCTTALDSGTADPGVGETLHTTTHTYQPRVLFDIVGQRSDALRALALPWW